MKLQLSFEEISKFQGNIWNFYQQNARIFPWRETNNPYHITVSEIMLQQTQTDRVAKKYEEFIFRFPDFKTLAQASLKDVLLYWQGLGYNRRAIYLQKIAQKVESDYAGKLPNNPKELITFPGIGSYTSCSIPTFAYNIPTVFIETNIRALYIFFFFSDKDKVKDSDILNLIEQTVDTNNPREWYYALMDFGADIKKQFKNPNIKSAHYTIQSKFEGSDRQIRGQILKLLTQKNELNNKQIIAILKKDPKKTYTILEQLTTEGFLQKNKDSYSIAS